MRKEPGSNQGRRNAHAARQKQVVTIRLDDEAVAYFKSLSVKSGLPYQTLINLYLRDCATTGRTLRWSEGGARPRSAAKR